MGHLRDACPYKATGLMNGRGVLTWYTGTSQLAQLVKYLSDLHNGRRQRGRFCPHLSQTH